MACDPGQGGVGKGGLEAAYCPAVVFARGMGGSRAVMGTEGESQFKKNGPDTVLRRKGEKPLLVQERRTSPLKPLL